MLETRLAGILEKLDKNGSVETDQLSKEFGVTEKTIRHDLEKMEQRGLLKRVHGGAVMNMKPYEDAYSNIERQKSLAAKEMIAKAAYNYVRTIGTVGQVYFIDAGTTNYEFSRYLKNSSSIIITNDLIMAAKLSSYNCILHITGGKIMNNVNKYMVGDDAVSMINRHAASICFVGATSISIQHGFMTKNTEDIAVKQAMLNNSNIRICLADHTKFGKTSFVKFADLNEIDIIITDEASETQIADFKNAGIKLIVASQY